MPWKMDSLKCPAACLSRLLQHSHKIFWRNTFVSILVFRDAFIRNSLPIDLPCSISRAGSFAVLNYCGFCNTAPEPRLDLPVFPVHSQHQLCWKGAGLACAQRAHRSVAELTTAPGAGGRAKTLIWSRSNRICHILGFLLFHSNTWLSQIIGRLIIPKLF